MLILPGTTPAKAAVAHALVEDLVTLTCDVGKRIPRPVLLKDSHTSTHAQTHVYAYTQAWTLCATCQR